jgi:hypothetical protein
MSSYDYDTCVLIEQLRGRGVVRDCGSRTAYYGKLQVESTSAGPINSLSLPNNFGGSLTSSIEGHFDVGSLRRGSIMAMHHR